MSYQHTVKLLFFSSDGMKLSSIKQLPSRLSHPLPWPILFDFSRLISTAGPQIISWIDSFYSGIIQRGRTGGLALILLFIFGTGISSFLFPSLFIISPTEFLFLLELRYLRQIKSFLLHCFYHPNNISLCNESPPVIYTSRTKT